MKWTIKFMLALCVAIPAVAQETSGDQNKKDPKALEILKKADAAIKAVKTVQYDVTVSPAGWMKNFASSAKGHAILGGKFSGGGTEKYRYEVEVTRAGSSEVGKWTVGGNGEDFYVFDHAKKTALVDVDPSFVLPAAPQAAARLGMAEYVHDAPFSDEINGKEIELRGTVKIGNEECHKIFVAYSNVQVQAIWYFSTKDFLPRGVERLRANPQDPKDIGAVVWKLTNLVPDPVFVADPFKARVPDGYTMVEE